MITAKEIVIVAGVSGVGKTTIGRLLAERLSVEFFDADDFHSCANLERMRSGIPLIDSDREPWLLALNEHLKQSGPCVMACSALKAKYRTALANSIESRVTFVFLTGEKELISRRLKQRQSHFMPADLLESQFADLELPTGVVEIDTSLPPSEIVDEILKGLG